MNVELFCLLCLKSDLELISFGRPPADTLFVKSRAHRRGEERGGRGLGHLLA